MRVAAGADFVIPDNLEEVAMSILLQCFNSSAI
jgi:hypothetical protein